MAKTKGGRVTLKLCPTRRIQKRKYHGPCSDTSRVKVNDGPWLVICSWCGRKKRSNV